LSGFEGRGGALNDPDLVRLSAVTVPALSILNV
jgi:hypothetical protein